MIKLKTDYYILWKKLRSVANSTIKTGHYRNTGNLQSPIENYFYSWIKNNWEYYHYNDTVAKDIITLRESFLKNNPQI